MTTTTLWSKIIRWFYGIEELDEYREAMVNRIGNQLFMVHFMINLLSTALAFYLMKTPSVALDLLMWTNFIWFYVATGYMMFKSNQLGIRTHEVDEQDYETVKAKKLRQLKRASLLVTPLYHLFSSYSPSKDLLTEVLDWRRLLATAIWVLVTYLGFRFFLLKGIKIDKE
ncbi:DUF6773 family protein [Streptococcus entericus]|uniref:DUF6773 family protein n=1 Tax=Streptococcus entericus TaxID=155680 RepID=UPI0003686AEF|nr:DUF6773 family protein [Streptococcus entericus]